MFLLAILGNILSAPISRFLFKVNAIQNVFFAKTRNKQFFRPSKKDEEDEQKFMD